MHQGTPEPWLSYSFRLGDGIQQQTPFTFPSPAHSLKVCSWALLLLHLTTGEEDPQGKGVPMLQGCQSDPEIPRPDGIKPGKWWQSHVEGGS